MNVESDKQIYRTIKSHTYETASENFNLYGNNRQQSEELYSKICQKPGLQFQQEVKTTIIIKIFLGTGVIMFQGIRCSNLNDHGVPVESERII